ncbi:MAG: hypothetical protein ABSC56_04375 [Solirubrobacteraceae bacterium]|jgi:hypothetical protein
MTLTAWIVIGNVALAVAVVAALRLLSGRAARWGTGQREGRELAAWRRRLKRRAREQASAVLPDRD